MAKTTSESALIAELQKRSKGAWDDARNVAAKPKGFQELPGGINGAIGKVTGCDFKFTEDKGEGSCPMAQIKFVVKEPTEFAGTPQSKAYFFRDRAGEFPKTCAQILEDFSCDLQLLGEETAGTAVADIPTILKRLSMRKPYFKFNTFRPGDRTNILIQGLATDYTPAEDDITPADAEELVEAAETNSPPPRSGKPKVPPKKAPAPAAEEIEEVSDAPEVPTSTPYVPEVGDRFYVALPSGDKHACEVVEVLTDEEKAIVLDEKSQKKLKVTFEKIRKDNAD